MNDISLTMKKQAKNPTKEDISICPNCEFDLFYILDGNRLFCSKCKKEIRNNKNFQGGILQFDI